MTGPADVLAVIDADAREAWAGRLRNEDRATANEAFEKAKQTYAAVAELIRCDAVMREALADLKAQCDNNLKLGATGPGYWTDARETIDAALLSAGGPK